MLFYFLQEFYAKCSIGRAEEEEGNAEEEEGI
jgi:hypothetical protein